VKIALLPAKPLPLAKTRLSSVLGPEERAAVSRAMFDDVVAALLATRALDAVLVVTADRDLAARARAAGGRVVDEGRPRGLNGAVVLGTTAAQRLGASALLVLLSDVPLITPADMEELFEHAPVRGALVVPSKEGIGTNALLRRPPNVLAPCFGGRSLERHVAAAERHHVACAIWRNVRIGFDVDTPDDLRALASASSGPATTREMVRFDRATSSAPSAVRST
jgi:2-phospho-L-lactate guanylyltransferase